MKDDFAKRSIECRERLLSDDPVVAALARFDAIGLMEEKIDSQAARIKHLEGIIERTKNEANLYYGTGDLLDILNEA